MSIAVMITYDNLHHLEKLLDCVSTNKTMAVDDEAFKWLTDSVNLLKGNVDFSVEPEIT